MLPFPGGPDSLANGTLLLSVAAALLYLWRVDDPPLWRRSVVKTASTALLSVLAAVEGGHWLLVAGLALGALGDAFLSRDGERPFLLGLASFLAAHVAYVALFALAGAGAGLILAEGWRIGLAVLMIVAASVMLSRLWPALPQPMRAPVALYVAAILAMVLSALTLREPLVIAGAVMFVASDALLAIGRFLMAQDAPQQGAVRRAVWILYYAGQTLIALGALT